MAGYILREDQPNIVLPAQQADRLIGRGDGDAALLYLCLLRADVYKRQESGSRSSRSLLATAGWERPRRRAVSS